MELGNILVVDDSSVILETMKVMLQALDVDASLIHTADGGEAALQCIAEHPDVYRVIFVDLQMPGVDGMELIRLLGQRGYEGSIVIFSAMEARIINLATELALEHKAHLVGVVSKPLDIEKIDLALRKVAAFNHRVLDRPQLIDADLLESAIVGQRIVPYYQPKVVGRERRVRSLEVLARIRQPEGENLTPEVFITRAEDHHWLGLITFQLLGKVFDEYPQIRAQFGYDVKLSFNLAPSQLDDFDLPEKLTRFLARHQVDPSRLTLEITETSALRTPAQLETLNRLRLRGFGLSLDDYGVGFTNVKQLRLLPFTEIKIDRTLIDAIHADAFSQSIVASLAGVADIFAIDLVAEGLELAAEFDFLQKIYPGMLLQGFLIASPKPLAGLLQWYSSWEGGPSLLR